MKSTFLILLSVLFVGFVIIGCDSDNPIDNSPSPQDILASELAGVKTATEKYHNVDIAIRDGYVDIDLFVPNMGSHFLNADLLDAKFDMKKPELLVYSPGSNGGFILTAVEYAVPVELSADAPKGFTGEEDQWVINEDFGLWVVHAWVWYDNYKVNQYFYN
jgi:hypothetical protein